MNLGITKQDKTKSKWTFSIFAVIFAISIALTIVFAAMLPKAHETKALGNGEEIKSIVETDDGDDYFLASNTALYRYDSFTNKLLSTFYFSEIEKLIPATALVDDSDAAEKVEDGEEAQA